MTQALKECDGAPPTVRAALLSTAGLVAYYLQDHDTSRRRLREAVALHRQLGDKRRTGWSLIKLSTSYFVHPEEYEEGAALCEESIKLLQDADDLAGVALGLNHLSILACVHGDLKRARTVIEECLYLATEIGDKLREAVAYANLSEIGLNEGDTKRAMSFCKKALVLSLEIENIPIVLSGLLKMAQTASARGEPEKAARLAGAVEALHEKNGIVLQPQEQPLFERHVSATREQLGTQAFDMAWNEGRSMRLREAVAYALEETPTDG